MRYLFLVALLLSVEVSAQAYKCVVNGKSVYSDVPCAIDARNVGAMQDRVTVDQQIDRARANSKEKHQLNNIEQEKAIDAARHQRLVELVSEQDRAISREKTIRCNRAQTDKRIADRRAARYQDWGWQQSLNQAKKEQESSSRDVRDHCD